MPLAPVAWAALDRHPALQDLSRDHHQILVLCTHVDRAREGEPGAPDPGRAASDLARAWAGDLPAHLREEEEVLLPAASRAGPVHQLDGAALLHDDHAWLRDRLDALVGSVADGDPDLDLAAEIAGLLRRHVEVEERRLYPALQDRLDADDLEAVGEASRAFREAHRGPEAVGPRTGD